MTRTTLVAVALVATLLSPAHAQVTPADAAPFLGDWTLALQGDNGPGTFNLSITAEGDKVVGEISSEVTPVQKITSVSKTAKGLVLSYSFPYEGMSVDAAITLTPGPEGKMAAQADFASGAYTMTGTAVKKEKAK